MPLLNILHLVGSAQNDFYCDLSRLYAQDCLVATAERSRYHFQIAYITPDGKWRFPRSLNLEDIAIAKPISLVEAIQFITAQNIDLVLPQMFCIPGMTYYRALFDLLKIPCVGNSADIMAIASHKARTKAIVAAAGVKVPRGELLRPGDVPTITPPVVIKPVSSDNSLGVALVKEASDYEAALQTAFEYADEVIVETFIELGREVRCGIIVKDGDLVGLPLEEYKLDPDEKPIRNYADKLQKTDDGNLSFSAKDNMKSWIVDPSDPITKRVQEVAKMCHQALGCRHYSLFDFRIDPQGQPWFLEAGLYCSFAPKSVISCMAKAQGIPLNELFMTVIHETLSSSNLHQFSCI
ncbi:MULTISPECIES: D-alanine--D-alanine ligase family protein [Cyanophyceae]|uniref:D-alanine--D-alanine ligase family protein n=1 Tax=Cyanophyceae TaxID=3028117 RepID=UPI00232D0ACC|nr:MULTISPECIES: D-alanine--D-alanine ligase [Cyanophyceae]MDB9355729.1 D-alanine--D-alanine ligase [Nodularia spumigena CS-587/03]MDB9340020.1 D-alanine--D-alanine ligase [Nodularia spumigena CS-589/07]MDB9402080.1 D-alanine--D-alanine ligase [Microcystis aeruginosa CS-567/02-A1]MDB9500537.1 D-alanine--D-alanine ligase [Nodularia spumigena CS-336/02]MDB9530929.1 D-alanine--D-alanine ligase [Nodularia spumigena CS-1038]